ncbi:hypothetical protein MHYP_G00044360 [Metynnis hypsauchen]
MVQYFRLVCGSAGVMAESMKFTRCLLELPKFTVNDVCRIVRASSTTPQSKLEKGFKFYVSSYLCNFEKVHFSRATAVSSHTRPPSIAGMKADSLPLICTMNISPDKPLVDSIFGKVQVGSVLSYQQPPPPSDSVVIHEDAPPFPSLPLEGYHLSPPEYSFVPTHQEQLHLSSLSVTLSQSHLIEEATRCQSATPEWHSLRRERVTASHFREVSHVRGPGAAESLAERIIRGTRQTAHMKRGLEMETGALKDYAVLKNLNLTKCGLVIHPDASWLGASPDGLVYDPLERPSFGLVEIKCPNAQSYVDCKFLKVAQGLHKLKESHCYYWQIQGQLLITGMQWCDFVICAHDDIFVQRVYRDSTVLEEVKRRCDMFFFNTYMPKYLSMPKQL